MAVYTDVSTEDLEAFLDAYGIGAPTAFKGIAEGVENSNFMLQTETGDFILTLYEKRVSEEDLPYFLGLMHHLAQAGFPCPTPVAGRDGEALRRLCDRPAAIVTFLSGLSPYRIEPEHCESLGAAMARMHLAAADFPMHRANNLSVEGWRGLVEACSGRADEVRAGLADEIAGEFARLESRWPMGLPEGVIHADLFPDNVFFNDGAVTGFIDFYFACNDAFAYDLAICLNAWCFQPDGAFNVTKARRMIRGYASVRPLSAEEVAALPILARGSALRFLLTRLYDWLNHPEGALVKPKDPMEYFRYLRFHQQISSPSGYGIDP